MGGEREGGKEGERERKSGKERERLTIDVPRFWGLVHVPERLICHIDNALCCLEALLHVYVGEYGEKNMREKSREDEQKECM